MVVAARAQQQSSGVYDLSAYLAIARRRWGWIAAAVIVLVSATTYWTLNQPPRYYAEAQVLLADTASQRTLDPSSQNTSFLSRELANEILVARSDEVRGLVSAELGATPDVVVNPGVDADVLVFSITLGDADDAALYVNVWAEQYIEVKTQQVASSIEQATRQLEERLIEIGTERSELPNQLVELTNRILGAETPEEAEALRLQYDLQVNRFQAELGLNTAEAEAALAGLTQLNLQQELAASGEARFVTRAVPPTTTVNAPLSRNLPVALFVGLIWGAALALFAHSRDTSISSTSDVASITDLPVLASVPRANKRQQEAISLAVYRDPEGHFAQAFHKVRTSIEFASIDSELKTILVTSPNAGDGKSTTSTNLALALATVGTRTVLVDVDFRRARIHRIFSIRQSPGLSDTILNSAKIGDTAYTLADPGLENLLVVPTGIVPPSPAAFVGTTGFAKTIKWIGDNADMVVLDAPPLLAVSDPHAMARDVDAVVLTVMAGETSRPELAEAITSLNQVGANLLGIVLIGVDASESYGRYYYTRTEEPLERGEFSQGSSELWDQPGDSQVIDLSGRSAGSSHLMRQGSVPPIGVPQQRG